MKYYTDLILGEAFCVYIFFYFPDLGLSVYNGLRFFFYGLTEKQRVNCHLTPNTEPVKLGIQKTLVSSCAHYFQVPATQAVKNEEERKIKNKVYKKL